MPSGIGNFIKGQDQLGSGISLNYRGESTYGTILGGCLSLLLSLFIAAFMIFQAIAWAFVPDYNQTIQKSYLFRTDETVYTIPTTNFMPTFGLISVPRGL